MAEFKILGGTAPASTVLGVMTQGLGYPLHDVEPAVSGGAVTVKTETVLLSASFIDQNPVGLGTALQVTFGAPETNTDWSIDAAGKATCLVADEYTVNLKVSTGREGAGGVSQLYIRVLINGVQAGNSTHTIIDNPRIEIPQVYSGVVNFNVGDELTVEIIRDTDGNDSGGLRAGVPDVVGWNESPSAQLRIDRTFALVTTS